MRAVLIVVAVLAVGAAVSAQSRDDKPFIDLAKQADVSALDKTLPKQRFDDWLTKAVGPKATISWGRTDCGEATGGPADQGRDLPICVEAAAKLPDGRQVVLQLAVGSRKRGLSKAPSGFYDISIQRGGNWTSFDSLSKLAAALRAK